MEDPFEDWHDLGQVVNKEGQVAIEKELKRAASLLAKGTRVAMLVDVDPNREVACEEAADDLHAFGLFRLP